LGGNFAVQFFEVKKQQWLVISISIVLTATIFLFGRTVPKKETPLPVNSAAYLSGLSTDTILSWAKQQLNQDQLIRITELENSVSRGDVKKQKLDIYHQLAHFWGDSIGIFAPYAWYEAEAARLENSEKTLTFAAHLFLDYLQQEQTPELKRWEALQAKDLFERSLKINPDNDSSKVGLGACYLFGNISAAPMEGISKIREVVEKDSTNVYAQITLAKGSIMSGQFDKAISRLNTVIRLQPDNIEAILMLADTYERSGDSKNAVSWYKKSLDYIKLTEVKAEIEKRIAELTK
jgi:tetratricopeptide (TPR) repeat protein